MMSRVMVGLLQALPTSSLLPLSPAAQPRPHSRVHIHKLKSTPNTLQHITSRTETEKALRNQFQMNKVAKGNTYNHLQSSPSRPPIPAYKLTPLNQRGTNCQQSWKKLFTFRMYFSPASVISTVNSAVIYFDRSIKRNLCTVQCAIV